MARMGDRAARAARMTIGRALITLIQDSAELQTVQAEVLGDELHDGLEHQQQYGLTSRPLSGAEGLFLAIGAARGNGVVICIEDRRYRLKNLQPGEVALYDDQGQVVKLARAGIEVTTSKTVTVTATGDVTVTSEGKVVVLSDDVRLGGTGGAAVARVGDLVSGGHVITGGSTKVKAS